MTTLADPLTYNGSLYDVPDDLQTEMLDAVTESAYRGAAMGSATKTWSTFLTRIDKFGKSPFQINREYRGMTFITRPKLNFTDRSLAQDRQMQMLNSYDGDSFAFAIRCLLDTKFARSDQGAAIANSAQFFNDMSAFNIPLGNALVGMTGWPDPSLDVETTAGGYFSEDQTTVRGTDWGRRTYDFTLTFRDFQGGFVMATIYYWLRAMGLLSLGGMTPYVEDIDQFRLCYTVSIYRFILDPSKRFITKWAKATGCFPVSLPLGEVFNFNSGDEFIPTSREFSVNFKVNHVEYMDPIILENFVTLSSRYGGKDLINAAIGKPLSEDNVIVPYDGAYNYAGLPTIDLVNGGKKLLYVASKDQLVDPTETVIRQIDNNVTDYINKNILASNATYSAAKSQATTIPSDTVFI